MQLQERVMHETHSLLPKLHGLSALLKDIVRHNSSIQGGSELQELSSVTHSISNLAVQIQSMTPMMMEIDELIPTTKKLSSLHHSVSASLGITVQSFTSFVLHKIIATEACECTTASRNLIPAQKGVEYTGTFTGTKATPEDFS